MGLSPEQLMALAQEHEAAEFTFDLDTTMATLIDHPIYLWFPHRLRVEGREAVREMYACLAPVIEQMQADIENRVVHFMAFGEDQLAAEIDFEYKFADGTAKKVRIAAFLPFEDGRLVGETQYVDSDLAAELDVLFHDEFRRLPGVSFI
jgi:ketosteroid isomerase-like protein